MGGERRGTGLCGLLAACVLLSLIAHRGPLYQRVREPMRTTPTRADAPARTSAATARTGFTPLNNSSIASEREYARMCANISAGCGRFDDELRDYTEQVHATVGTHGRVLLLYDEYKPIGLSQHWLKRQLALWLGMGLRRAVYIVHCDDSGRFERMRACNVQHFDMETHFSIRGGASLAWTAQVARAAAAAGARREVVLDFTNWSLAASEPVASEPLLALRLFFNLNSALEVRSKLFKPEHRPLLGTASRVLGSERCLQRCSGFAVTRPSPSLAALVAPVERRLRLASRRIGMHVRTMAADAPLCFPDSTPPTASAIDAAFGNNECMHNAFDHWRFKLVPLKPFRDSPACPAVHLADVTPLTGWLRCAAKVLPVSRGIGGLGGHTRGVGARGPADDGTVAVFLATDAPALHRYASLPGALSDAPDAVLLTLDDSRAIAHTHQRPHSLNLSAEAVRAVHARGAADWYLLTLADVILAPIESAFTQTVCIARPDTSSCSLLSPRTDFRSMRGPGVCSLRRCFPESIRCEACQWRSEYMGKRLLRAVVR